MKTKHTVNTPIIRTFQPQSNLSTYKKLDQLNKRHSDLLAEKEESSFRFMYVIKGISDGL